MQSSLAPEQDVSILLTRGRDSRDSQASWEHMQLEMLTRHPSVLGMWLTRDPERTRISNLSALRYGGGKVQGHNGM